jgi:hypothetical protein
MMTDLPTKAISLHAPWAWALMFAGKDVENRSPRDPRWLYAKMPVDVWVQASLWPGFDPLLVDKPGAFDFGAETEQVKELSAVDDPYLPHTVAAIRGHIIGRVTLTDKPNLESRWRIEGALWVGVENAIPLRTPVPAKGQQGIWPVKPDVLAQLKGLV